MRVDFTSYPSKEKRRASSRIRLVTPSDVEKVSYKPIYWTLPFLLKLWEKVDEVAQSDPKYQLQLATQLPIVAERIRVDSSFTHYYRSNQERNDFVMVCRAVLSSALIENCRLADAEQEIRVALDMARKTKSAFAVGEVSRRAAFLALQQAHWQKALRFGKQAEKLLTLDESWDYAALAVLYQGHAKDRGEFPGAGTAELLRVFEIAAKSRSKRSKRAVGGAASSLACNQILSDSVELEIIERLIAEAMAAMKGQPRLSLPRLKLAWMGALAGHRRRLSRYAINRLSAIRDQLLKLGAYRDAVLCTADLISIVEEEEPESFDRAVNAAVTALRTATPEEAMPLIDAWADRPSDVALLRQLAQSEAAAALASDS